MSLVFEGPGFCFALGRRTYIMGILNVTPDSFSDGGSYSDPQRALAHALQMQQEGADILDVGAESTRPGHEPVDAAEELRRLLPVLDVLRGKLMIPVSVDTTKPEVAEAALARGAVMINDVNGFLAEGMAQTVCRYHAAAVIMHPGFGPYPGGVCAEVRAFLSAAAEKAQAAGIPASHICLDPGIGFGKSYEENLMLLRDPMQANPGGYAFLVGASRKSVVAKSVGEPPPKERLWGTLAAHTLAVAGGADILRVHDVAPAMQAARMADAVCRSSRQPE